MTYFIELNKAKEETRVIDDETSGIVTNQQFVGSQNYIFKNYFEREVDTVIQ